MTPKDYKKWIPADESGILGKKAIQINDAGRLARAVFLHPLWGGTYRVNSDYACKREYMNSFLLFFIESGSLDYVYEGASFTAHAGDVVLLDCKNHNDYRSSGLTRFSYLHFQGNGVQAYADYLQDVNGPLFTDSQDAGDELTSILDQMRSGDVSLSRRQLDELLHRRLEHVLVLLTRRVDESLEVHYDDNVPPDLSAAIRYINRHFDSDVSIHALSKILNTSESQLSHAFKRHLDMGVHQFVLECRISHAKYLLTTSKIPIAQITKECGFTVSSHFSSSFKKLVGVSPSEFRREFS